VAALEANSDLQGQLLRRILKKDLCLLRSLVVHAAAEPGVRTSRTYCLHSGAVRVLHRSLRGSLKTLLCFAAISGWCIMGRLIMLARKLAICTGLLCGGLGAPIVSL